MTKPITPDEVVSKKAESIPPAVVEAFNELVAEKWDGTRAIVTVQDAVSRILKKNPTIAPGSIFDNHWLDVEGVYRKAGWVVSYDQPAYNESYLAHFVFSKHR